MQDVRELQRRPSPGGRPQPLAFSDGRLWIGSWDTDKLYAVDPVDWSVTAEAVAPGKPYGLAAFGGAIAAVISVGEDDDRYLYRFDPERGFDPESKLACPDFTGSHLATDGTTLYLCQQGKRRILALDEAGSVAREIPLATRCCGFAFDDGDCYMLSADEEFENLALARLNLRDAEPNPEPIAGVPFDGRALAFDGSRWWTSHREANEIVAFQYENS
jgi:hypothetical protein